MNIYSLSVMNANFATGSGLSLVEDTPLSEVQTSSTSTNTIMLTRLVAPAAIAVTKIYFFATSVGAGDTIMVGIYNNAGTTLLTQGKVLSASIVVGLNVVTVPSANLVAGTIYRVAIKGVTGVINFAAYTSLSNAMITASVFDAGATLPASTSTATANTTAPWLAVGV